MMMYDVHTNRDVKETLLRLEAHDPPRLDHILGTALDALRDLSIPGVYLSSSTKNDEAKATLTSSGVSALYTITVYLPFDKARTRFKWVRLTRL